MRRIPTAWLSAVLLLLLFTACSYDEGMQTHKTPNGTQVRRGSFQDFPELQSLYGKLRPQMANARLSDSIENFDIDSTKVTQAIKNGKTYYTLAIKKDDPNQSWFKNLVLVKQGESLYKVYVAKYFPSEDYYNKVMEGIHAEFEGSGQIKEIQINTSALACVTFTYLVCSNGGTDHPAGDNCTAEDIREESFQICWTYDQDYYFDMGPSPAPGPAPPPSNGPGPGTGNGDGNPPPSNPNPPDEEDDEIVTEVIVPGLEDGNGNPLADDPCEQLKAFASSTGDYKQKFDWMCSFLDNSENREYGIQMKVYANSVTGDYNSFINFGQSGQINGIKFEFEQMVRYQTG